LGVVLGQVNRLGAAHLHLGRYYHQKHDWNLAFFHYSKAKALLLDSPQKLDELNQVLKEVEKRKTAAHWERLRK
jgi:hypothetical protein